MGYADDHFFAEDLFGLIKSVLSLAWWLITLPFRIIGWIFGYRQQKAAERAEMERLEENTEWPAVGLYRHILQHYDIKGEEKRLKTLLIEGAIDKDVYNDIMEMQRNYERETNAAPDPDPMATIVKGGVMLRAIDAYVEEFGEDAMPNATTAAQEKNKEKDTGHTLHRPAKKMTDAAFAANTPAQMRPWWEDDDMMEKSGFCMGIDEDDPTIGERLPTAWTGKMGDLPEQFRDGKRPQQSLVDEIRDKRQLHGLPTDSDPRLWPMWMAPTDDLKKFWGDESEGTTERET
jgi:hypothetical protein